MPCQKIYDPAALRCPECLGKGETWRVAVEVIDLLGNEGLRVLTVKE